MYIIDWDLLIITDFVLFGRLVIMAIISGVFTEVRGEPGDKQYVVKGPKTSGRWAKVIPESGVWGSVRFSPKRARNSGYASHEM